MKRGLRTACLTVLGVLAVAAAAMAQAPNRIVFNGDVDDTARIHFQGTTVVVDNIHGKGVWNVRYWVGEPLPPFHVPVHLEDVSGRGTVQIVREPWPRDGFTTTVQIYDPQAGAGHYHFVLVW
jgi:hypothetical protein